MKTLSKSDFKVARTCDTKLYYKELGYPNTFQESELLELLADGGYMVEKLAKLTFPDGIELAYEGASETAARETMRQLGREDVTLFEGTLLHGALLARADILVKRGRRIELIEVKAKSFDSSAAGALRADGFGILPRRGDDGIPSEWNEYVEDVAFQAHVLRACFPDAEIAPYLLLVDTAKSSTVEALHQCFDLRRDRNANGFDRVRVTFTDRDDVLARIRAGDHFLTRVDVAHEVAVVAELVAGEAERLARSIAPELRRLPMPQTIACRGCEYRVDDERSGFSECWGDRARPAPHVLDLYHLQKGTTGTYVQGRIEAGACALVDLDVERLVGANGNAGATNIRQRMQVENTRAGREWVSAALGATMRAHAYPLRFIDFEASALAVPYHAGMHPYERVAYQWSCHTVRAPGARPEHQEWINTTEFFPNFEFARTLGEAVGTDGTVFMWHHFERNVLREIRAQMDARGVRDPALAAALESLTARLKDQNRLCLDHYFHPRMGKSTSIKRVLDAVWRADPQLRRDFPEYAVGDASPYDALPAAEIAGERVEVAEGTGAMRAYQAMLYGPARHDPGARAAIRDLLLRYCKLDTAAMVMIWDHWLRITA